MRSRKGAMAARSEARFRQYKVTDPGPRHRFIICPVDKESDAHNKILWFESLHLRENIEAVRCQLRDPRYIDLLELDIRGK